MFGSLGVPELIFIFALALLIFGPRKLPEIGRTLGRGLSEFRKASTELKRSLNTEMIEEEMRQSDPREILREDTPAPSRPSAPPAAGLPPAAAAKSADAAPATAVEPAGDAAADDAALGDVTPEGDAEPADAVESADDAALGDVTPEGGAAPPGSVPRSDAGEGS